MVERGPRVSIDRSKGRGWGDWNRGSGSRRARDGVAEVEVVVGAAVGMGSEELRDGGVRQMYV